MWYWGNIVRAALCPDGRGERRAGADRRTRPTPPFSRYWLRGRRRGGRRGGDEAAVYVDRYTPREWVLILGVLALSALDLCLTLVHLRAGGREVNPVMDLALQGGEATFAAVKLGTTLAGLLILLLHVRFRPVRPLLNVLLTLYAGVIVYHLALRMGVI